MVRWTNEQQEAIDTRHSNILVAAAAGSGKTAVLVERIIRRIVSEEDPIDIDQLLVATFTNAAAEEMRERIGLALEKAMKANPQSYHLKKQLALLQKANISTIHSFCLNIVRQYSYLIDIDPAFRIADDLEIELLKHEVIDELFEEYYGKEGEELELFFNIADMYSSDRSDVELEELILKLHTFAKQHPWPEIWLGQIAEVYNVTVDTQEDEIEWLSLLKQELKEQFITWKEQITKATHIARESDGPFHYLEALEQDLRLIDDVLKLTDNWNELQQYVESAKLKSLSNKRIDCDEEKKERVKKLRDQFRTQWNELKKRWFSRNLQGHLTDMATLYPLIKQIVQLVIEFEERFQRVKRERNVVDFNDLEHFSLEILLDEQSTLDRMIPSTIAKQYENQFKEILVDEYQDINLVQETIIRSISNKEAPGNIFMVGDVKQSIYRFRHAEPTLFIEKYKQYETDERAGKRIDLAKNFRSRNEVLQGANFIFRQIFDETFGEIDYDEKAELIYGNESYLEHPLQSAETELIIIDRESKETDDVSEEVEQLTNMQLEAKLYAKKIREWIGNEDGKPLKVVDKATGKQREIRYRDIVILLRSMTGATTIVDELKKQGIPVYAELKTGYFAAIEIQIMLNVLKVIDNPYQDIPLVSVLRSPIVGLNEEQLAQIRLEQRDASFYDAVKKYAKKQTESARKVAQFLEQLITFRKRAREYALSEVIWTIFQDTGYYDYVGGIPGGRQRQANLRALYDRARSYEQTSFRGLFRFLRFIENMQKKQSDLGEARALSEQEDVVRIMTIHKSKGLEFPVVILGNMNKQFNFTDLRGKYLLNKEFGFATKYIDPEKRIMYPTLYNLAVSEEEKRKMLSEEMRVLYVGLTRAKEKLVLIGNVDSFSKRVEKWADVLEHDAWVLPVQLRKDAKTYLDWIGPSLVRHKRSTILHGEEAPSRINEEIWEDDSKWNIQVVTSEQVLKQDETKQLSAAQLQQLITQWKPFDRKKQANSFVEERLSFTYPFESSLTHRAKQSVTELKRRYEEADEYSEKQLIKQPGSIATVRPSFLQTEKVLTATEIGTAMHTVMQHIPLTKKWIEKDLETFLDRLVREEKLTGAEREAIDVAAIESFFASKLGQLLLENDVKREVPFTYALHAKDIYPNWTDETDEKVLIQGVIDCVIFTDNGLILLDYKTDRIPNRMTREEVEEVLRERYQLQLSLYKQALEEILQMKVIDVYIYAFQTNIVVTLP